MSMKKIITEVANTYETAKAFEAGDHRMYMFAQNRGMLDSLFPDCAKKRIEGKINRITIKDTELQVVYNDKGEPSLMLQTPIGEYFAVPCVEVTEADYIRQYHEHV